MKKFVMASMVALGLSNMALAADPCSDREHVVPNSWLISVNEEDQSSKQDILTTLKLLSKGGFEIRSMFDFADPDIVLATYFRPDYYYDQDRADEVKNSVLEELQTLDGVKIRCNGINYPFPAVGVR